MADKKTESKTTLEREYVIPLRKEWQKVSNYRRTGRAVKFIKKFIAKHMKVPERDLSKVKLDVYLNQEVWFRGRKNPPARIKVKAIKEGDIVKVSLVELPKIHEYAKSKHDKRHLASAKTAPKAKAKDDKKEEKSEEDKKKEAEKEKSAADLKQAELKQDAKAQKHLTAAKPETHHRVALKK